MKILELTGEVGGPGFSIDQVTDLPAGPLHVRIDSMGGCSTTGWAVYHELREHAAEHPVTCEIVRAGSAAVPAALAGSVREIHGAGEVFVHPCWHAAVGTRRDLLRAAIAMRRKDRLYVEVIAERTGQPRAVIWKLCREETRIDAREAVRLGFAHRVLGTLAEPPSPASRKRTALHTLGFQERAREPDSMNQFHASEKAALAVPGAETALRAEPPPGQFEVARQDWNQSLDRIAEARRRGDEVRAQLRNRISQVSGSRDLAPGLVVSWQCTACSAHNYHRPADEHGLATPCRNCGATHTMEE